MPIELITAGGWLFSLGDIAVMNVTANEMAKRGIPIVKRDVPSGKNPCIIGGGHVLGKNKQLLHFIHEGRHALNAVGVHPTEGGYPYLSEYRYLSARDFPSAERTGFPCSVVPCPSIMTSPSDISFREVPCRRREGQIVVHRDAAVSERIKDKSLDMIVVDPQPWRNSPWGIGGQEIPATHSPEILVASMKDALCVITRSLHLSIFALCAQVPFVCIDTGEDSQSQKMRDYWAARGMPEVVCNTRDPVEYAISLGTDWSACIKRQIAAVETHFNLMAESFRD